MAYEINYNDERFTEVEADKKEAMNEVEQTYDGMINESDSFYQAQIDASKDWADTQTQIQQDKTDFAIEQIEQQKDQAHKDYLKEQSGAYVDWQRQSNQYGVNAEQMASAGLQNSGYSESSQVAMYNTYQNRVATARDVYNRAVLNYDNAIKDAQLQNNSALAEIAYNALQTQLQLGLEGFQYKNSLIIEKANKKTEVDDRFYNRYQDVVAQINHENATAEQIRQYNESLEEEKRQYDQSFAEEQRQYNQNYDFQNKQFEEDKRQYEKSFAENQRQFNASLAEDKRQFNAKQGDDDIKNDDENVKPGDGNPSAVSKVESSILSKNDFTKKAEPVYRGTRGNVTGYTLNGVQYGNYDNYVYKQIEKAYNSGSITEDEANQLLEKYGF